MELVGKAYLDFDGVLAISEPGGKAIADNLGSILDVPKSLIFDTFRKYGQPFLLGQESLNDFLEIFSQKIDKHVKLEQLADAYATVPINEPLLDLIKKLRKQAYSVELVSNNSKYRFEVLKERKIINVWNIFDKVHLSSQLKKFKKDFLYDVCDIQRGVFIDNNQEFLKAINKIGAKTIYYDSIKHNINYLLSEFKKYDIIL